MWDILPVLLSLFILFINGAAVLFLFSNPKSKRFSNIEVAVFSFPLGYAVLTLIGVILGQFGLLVQPINLIILITIPIVAFSLYIHRRQKGAPPGEAFFSNSDNPQSSFQLSHIFLIAVLALGIFLRLESQLPVTWLGDQDPYYHLSFIDSIMAQGTLPYRTFWGFYSYPASFHVVFANLLSVTQADRFLFMKIVPEFLGFLCVPAAYLLVKTKYGEWAGVASAAFLSISSFNIYRTNIPIPEPLALLGMLMFFLAITTQVGTRRYVLAGLFASMVFLTNVVGIMYFVPSVVALFIFLVFLRSWVKIAELLKAILLGLFFSGLYWIPTLYKIGITGVLQGLGPTFSQGAMSFTSNTYFAWIGWGASIFAIVGVFVCIKDFKKTLVIIVPATVFIFFAEASNNGFYILDNNLLFRGLLYLGTWICLLGGIGFGYLFKSRQKLAAIVLGIVIFSTIVSFPVFSHQAYPVTWQYDNADFVYRSYLNNYSNIFKSSEYKVYADDLGFNYGAFNNVILERELPQLKQAALNNDSTAVSNLLSQENIKYLVINNGTAEANSLIGMNYISKYYEDWHTIVLVVQ